ncbi:MAG: flagellar protein FlgN [Moorella humiferrea]|nr:flagellar protein FlgN [Moorella humiferrea]
MENLYEQFITLLGQELALLEKMRAVAEKQNSALRANDLDLLNRATGEMQALLQQVNVLETSRRELHSRLEQMWGMATAATLEELLAALPPVPAKEKLAALAEDLRATARALAEQVKSNNLLSQNALRFNTSLLRALAHTPGRTYLPDGSMEEDAGEISLVDKSV